MLATYFFDSLPSDCFRVTRSVTPRASEAVSSDALPRAAGDERRESACAGSSGTSHRVSDVRCQLDEGLLSAGCLHKPVERGVEAHVHAPLAGQGGSYVSVGDALQHLDNAWQTQPVASLSYEEHEHDAVTTVRCRAVISSQSSLAHGDGDSVVHYRGSAAPHAAQAGAATAWHGTTSDDDVEGAATRTCWTPPVPGNHALWDRVLTWYLHNACLVRQPSIDARQHMDMAAAIPGGARLPPHLPHDAFGLTPPASVQAPVHETPFSAPDVTTTAAAQPLEECHDVRRAQNARTTNDVLPSYWWCAEHDYLLAPPPSASSQHGGTATVDSELSIALAATQLHPEERLPPPPADPKACTSATFMLPTGAFAFLESIRALTLNEQGEGAGFMLFTL
ncbi:MAG: hypothetical protein EOO41_04760, partial [Methanobacteriota archaeon]